MQDVRQKKKTITNVINANKKDGLCFGEVGKNMAFCGSQNLKILEISGHDARNIYLKNISNFLLSATLIGQLLQLW